MSIKPCGDMRYQHLGDNHRERVTSLAGSWCYRKFTVFLTLSMTRCYLPLLPNRSEVFFVLCTVLFSAPSWKDASWVRRQYRGWLGSTRLQLLPGDESVDSQVCMGPTRYCWLLSPRKPTI